MIITILIFNLTLIILFYYTSISKKIGSDHAVHVDIILRIILNKYKFLTNYIFSIKEKYIFYPQLFHWFLSFLPEKIYKEKHIYINLTIKAIELISFNLFLFYLQALIGFEDIKLLYANIVFNIFPFSYAVWNAKNTGISARHIGLIAGQVYTYFIFIYYFSYNVYYLLPLFILVFIILLLSQMSMQYVLLSLPFYAIIFEIPEIVILPFLAYGLFYLIMPKVALNYIKGQYNHKRNYALFLADIFILKDRPSVYRDFVYDFWVKFKSGLKNGIVYMGMNPLVEIIYGLPFLWFVLYYSYGNEFGEVESILLKITLTCLGLFFLISFRKTRFLGEPQRYLEFVIPFISVLFVFYFGVEYLIGIGLFSLFLIVSAEVMARKEFHNNEKTNDRYEFISQLNKYIDNGDAAISNDNDLLKYLPMISIPVVRPDMTCYFKNKEEFDADYEGDYRTINKDFIVRNIEEYKITNIIVNELLYKIDKINISKQIELVFKIGKYNLYKVI